MNWIVAGLLLALALQVVLALEPSGPHIENKGVENGSMRPATMINTSGGTITTIIINATTQNPHWKAYVGNVTGTYVLEDAQNNSIYEWSLARIAGEVYVTRNDSIDWTSIRCANASDVAMENKLMNHSSTADDNINSTFSRTTHDPFWTATKEFTQNMCNYTLVTFVNDAAQTSTSDFQEILLTDGSSIVYTSLIENSSVGFDLGRYDFQLLVPEKGWSLGTSSTPYYFYVELA
jgi:hypothetical protein